MDEPLQEEAQTNCQEIPPALPTEGLTECLKKQSLWKPVAYSSRSKQHEQIYNDLCKVIKQDFRRTNFHNEEYQNIQIKWPTQKDAVHKLLQMAGCVLTGAATTTNLEELLHAHNFDLSAASHNNNNNEHYIFDLFATPQRNQCYQNTIHDDGQSILLLTLCGEKEIYCRPPIFGEKGDNNNNDDDDDNTARARIGDAVYELQQKRDYHSDCSRNMTCRVHGKIRDDVERMATWETVMLGPGDALHLPMRYAHQVRTYEMTIMLSIGVVKRVEKGEQK